MAIRCRTAVLLREEGLRRKRSVKSSVKATTRSNALQLRTGGRLNYGRKDTPTQQEYTPTGLVSFNKIKALCVKTK